MQGNGYIKYYLDSSGLIWNFDVDITKPWFRSWTVFSLLESIMGKTTFAELALSLVLSDSETKRSKEKRIPLRRKWSLMNIEDGNFWLSKKNPDVRQHKLKLSEILTILMKSEIGLYITASEKNNKKIGHYITVSGKKKKKMAFISLFQPAQQFFFSADSRKSWELPFLLSEKVLCCFFSSRKIWLFPVDIIPTLRLLGALVLAAADVVIKSGRN